MPHTDPECLHTIKTLPHLPTSQQSTQRLVDQFNADERQWQDKQKRLEPVGKSLRKRTRKTKRISSVHQDSVHSLAANIAEIIRGYPNLTVKKIPKQVLSRCEWGHDDYSLKVENLPKAPPKPGQMELI
jgi:hypothetical protein